MLRLFYGDSTRSVRILNIGIALISLLVSLIYLSGCVVVYMPLANKGFIAPTIAIVVLNIVFSILSFTVDTQHPRRLFKVMSLLLGALHQACIAASYVSDYPPFQPMILVSLLLVFWFIGATYYVLRVEGLYGNN